MVRRILSSSPPPNPAPVQGIAGDMSTLIRVCHHCGGEFNVTEQLFYTIGKEPTMKDKIDRKQKQRIWFFHETCFEEVAGVQYL